MYLGETDEEKINSMSYVFFQNVLAVLGKKLDYESVSNMYGRTIFDKKQGNEINKIITRANPLYKQSKTASAASFLAMPGQLKVVDINNKEQTKSAMGDISWFEEFMT